MKCSIAQREIEVFFDDLNEEAQKVFLEAMSLADSDDGNYDIVPIAVVPIPDEECEAD